MKVLVTGGAGYIGSHTCKELALEGHVPVTVDNLIYGHREFVKWGPFYEVDIRNTSKIEQIMKTEKIEAVMHFAAFAYVGESVKEPLKYYNNNTLGSLSLLEAMEKSSIAHFVFSSTCATYGIPEKTPISESTPQNPINPYGQSKLLVEKILQNLTDSNGRHKTRDFKPEFKAIALRYFNAAGADPEGELGEEHDPETHLIPLALRASVHPDTELQIFGDDYPTPDGTCIRDYIHVKDLASAHVKALIKLSKSGPAFEAFNLGIGKGYSVKDVVQTTESVTNQKVKARMSARRPGDPAILLADSTKAQKELGWAPKFVELRSMIETAYKWTQK
ncbi:MAG: UDP-glucose 4-epimerase GalE [Pseudobdellovibrionaceae bacterium]